jgi:hypothetical protein
MNPIIPNNAYHILLFLKAKPWGIKYEWKRTIIRDLMKEKGYWLMIICNGGNNIGFNS